MDTKAQLPYKMAITGMQDIHPSIHPIFHSFIFPSTHSNSSIILIFTHPIAPALNINTIYPFNQSVP